MIRPSYSDDSFGYTLPLPSQFIALSAHGPECHIEHNVLKNVLCFIMWYLVAMEIRVMLFLLVRFYMTYSTGQINVCADFEINRFRIDEVRRYAKIVCFIWRHVTPKRYVVRHGDCDTGQVNVCTDFEIRFKSYGSNSGFRVFGDLDLDLWHMFYFFCHTHCAWCTGISMRSFIRIRRVWMGDMLRLKFWKRPMLYNGVFGCHGNTCYVIFIGAILLYSIGPSNVCIDFEINTYKIDEVRKYANIVFYLTSRDAKTFRHASWELRYF